MLERVINDQQVAKGSTLLAPPTLSAFPPPSQPGSVVLHLRSRGRGNYWDGFPGEDWISLGPREQDGYCPLIHLAAGRA